ncbi:MAG: pteridine reductase [Neptuniibacter sp.]
MTTPKVALITGAVKRIGATISRTLHKEGYNLVLHYRHSSEEALLLMAELNQQRPCSAITVQADLNDMDALQPLADSALSEWGGVDLLVNNASSFYPTPLDTSTQQQWDELINSNLRAPYFLCSKLAESLRERNGCIINLIDIHAQRGLPGHPIYSIAKAGLQMMTLSLAKELAPSVRVNGVSPGPILWPEASMSDEKKGTILEQTLLGKTGTPEDLAGAVVYLSTARFVTGQILSVDGGKSLYSH